MADSRALQMAHDRAIANVIDAARGLRDFGVKSNTLALLYIALRDLDKAQQAMIANRELDPPALPDEG